MKDYSEIFKRAIECKEDYDVKKVAKIINEQSDMSFGDPDNWTDGHWNMLTPKLPFSYDDHYGFISSEYPIALLTKKCPDKLKCILDENNILYTELEEPLSCDENILKQYVPHTMVIDERFLDDLDFSLDDERFFLVLQRLETGHQEYIDSSNFMFWEIRK